MNKHTCYFCNRVFFEDIMEQVMVGVNSIFDTEKKQVWACYCLCSEGGETDE